ncbi:MAG: hypothetical protein ACC660_08750, partial [Acidimicrobiales bacterium]
LRRGAVRVVGGQNCGFDIGYELPRAATLGQQHIAAPNGYFISRSMITAGSGCEDGFAGASEVIGVSERGADFRQ